MINLTYKEIIERIKREVDISDKEIEKRVKQRLEQLSDLISKEGAAHIVANDLGVKLFGELDKRTFKIKELVIGMRNFEVVGKIINKFEVRTFKNDRREGKVGSFIFGDETGTLRVVLWGDLCEELSKFEEDDVIKISNGTIRQNNLGFKELHFTNKTKLLVNPEGEEITELSYSDRQVIRKNIIDLNENDFVELLGTIVQIFEPRFYSSCPECGKKIENNGANSVCVEHGMVAEKLVPILNLFFDDGTENIRVVCFRNQAEMLLGLDKEEMLKLRDDSEKFEDIRKKLLGKQIFIFGRVRRNDMFGRLELMAQNISEADPKIIAEELIKDIENKG